ncbi:T9SS type B sorting domain-containing protein, partial [Mangrovimonas aestuarii]|uniref:T9SS type B sorting domain-containing protein n=1 Tax=Mangrovimonas aestuarii TaxID=3018443 RepID=UPI002378DF0A
VSSPPVVSAQVTSGAFADDNTIEVTAMGTGDLQEFEYSLDYGAYQDSNVFHNVSAGEHTVTVRDKNGCGEASVTVAVMDYMKFFTPNGDGYNDTWTISAMDNQPDAKIYIFDRHGKLIKQLSPNGDGWDGTFNGSPMPANDYWFTVEYSEPRTGERKTFRSHFTLKR